MTAPDGVRAVRHAGALQCALSAAAKACACYTKGLTRIGDDALLSASELVTVAFDGGAPEAMALSILLDAVESVGDAARFDAIVAHMAGRRVVSAVELAWPDIEPGYEWYREAALAEAEEPPVILPAPVLTILAVRWPVRCRRCRYLKTWCCCPGGAR